MPINWALVPRRAVDDVLERLNGGASGVALIGNEGVGKTTLAGQVAEGLGRGEPVWVVGTLAQSSVPFGAFGPLLEIQDAGKPAALLQSAADSLLAHADSAPIIVDNARLLDPLSASLVYRLAQQAAGPLIVTVRSVLRAPQVVSALWNDGLLARVDLRGLDAEETAAVVAANGGGDAAKLYRRSAGNALHLRMLLSTGGTEDTLDAAIQRYLGGLTAPVREVLGYLCVFEPLSSADLAELAGEAAVEEATGVGAVQVRSSSVYSGHPLFLEQLAGSLTKAEVQRLRTAVAAQLAATPSRTPADRLGRTLLTLQGDGPVDGEAVVGAAQEALRLGDVALAERLARGALDRAAERADAFDARLALSTALGWQGRGREAEAVLGEVDPATLTEDQVMAWALPRAANQFWMLSEPERATTFLQNVRRRVSSPSARITLDALSGTFAMNAGQVGRAVDIAGEVLAAPDAPDMAVAWAASAAALSSARMGRFAEVGPLVQRALGAEYPGLLRFTVGLAETTTLLMTGQDEAALETARRFTDFAELAQPGRAIGEVLLAQVLLARGEPAAAAELMGPAAATLELTGYSWGPLSLMYLATALGQLGEVAASAMALSRAQSRHGTKSGLFTPELGVARAWRLATIGDSHAAIAAARDAARAAERTGQFGVAVWAWHQAARLGDPRAAETLSKLAESVDCAFTRAAIEEARAGAPG
ncbi:MAG TPA: AAA family ATPase [Mycobacterium sp.]|nr:AAA family ATPase [Mycobacterium sp.]